MYRHYSFVAVRINIKKSARVSVNTGKLCCFHINAVHIIAGRKISYRLCRQFNGIFTARCFLSFLSLAVAVCNRLSRKVSRLEVNDLTEKVVIYLIIDIVVLITRLSAKYRYAFF